MVSVRERIRINGIPLSENDFTRYFFEVWDRLDANPKVDRLSYLYICVFTGSWHRGKILSHRLSPCTSASWHWWHFTLSWAWGWVFYLACYSTAYSYLTGWCDNTGSRCWWYIWQHEHCPQAHCHGYHFSWSRSPRSFRQYYTWNRLSKSRYIQGSRLICQSSQRYSSILSQDGVPALTVYQPDGLDVIRERARELKVSS